MSEDPLQFRSGDYIMYRYVYTDSVNGIDSFGTRALSACARKLFKRYFPNVNLNAIDIQATASSCHVTLPR